MFQIRGGTASRPASAGRSTRHSEAKYVRAARAQSPRYRATSEVRQSRYGALAGRRANGAACGEHAAVDSPQAAIIVPNTGAPFRIAPDWSDARTAVEDRALAPEHPVGADDFERLSQASRREALARGRAPEVGHVPADEARFPRRARRAVGSPRALRRTAWSPAAAIRRARRRRTRSTVSERAKASRGPVPLGRARES